MAVLIDNRQNKHKIALKKIKENAQAILNALDCPDGELSLLIVDDSQIESLNRDYLKRHGPTNVIAFPMREGDYPDINPQLLGDVVISVETAAKEGKSTGVSTDERVAELLVHGILHLLGYDHEVSEQKAHEMESKSNELLKLIGK